MVVEDDIDLSELIRMYLIPFGLIASRYKWV